MKKEEEEEEEELKNKIKKVENVRKKLASEMSEILPNLYVGNRLNATCEEDLKKNGIKRILAIHDPLLKSNEEHAWVKNYKLIRMSDAINAKISAVFHESCQFIHEGRILGEPVLVHCLMGRSRSTTIAAAYLSTIHGLDGLTSLEFVRKRRKQTNPNIGFIVQLNYYAKKKALEEKELIVEKNDWRNEEMMKKDRAIINKYCPFAVEE